MFWKKNLYKTNVYIEILYKQSKNYYSFTYINIYIANNIYL